MPTVSGFSPDIVFLLDATSDMRAPLATLAKQLPGFFAGITTTTDTPFRVIETWRAKITAFRDWDYDDMPPFVDHPFVSTVPELQQQLDSLHCAGGGDFPECLLEGLYKLTQMPATLTDEPERPNAWRSNWRLHPRYVIAVTNAPFKEPLREPKAASIDDVLLACMNERLRLKLIAPAKWERFDTLAEVDKALWYKVKCSPEEPLELATALESLLPKIARDIVLSRARNIVASSDTEPL